MMRLLFVDDDALAREQIRRELSHARLHYDVVLVDSGAAAMAALGHGEFDAVISDLRMPAMDGPELLTQVRERFPAVVRVCMSGAMDDTDFLRVMPVTHQFLSKPIVGDALREVIDRACSLNSILQNQGIRTLIGRLNALPATARTFQELSDAMTEPTTHTADISRIVAKDTALSVKVLQIVNSSYFGRRSTITSIQAAVTFVGMEMIKSLALSACVFNALDASPAASRLMQDIQSRSLRKAHFARNLMKDSRHADEAFTAALLLDIGQAVLALCSPEMFAEVIQIARETNRPWHDVETEAFGVAHPEVGACLLGVWGLPLELIEAVAYHHNPSTVKHAQTAMLTAVHVADAVIDATADQPEKLLNRLDAAFVARTGVNRCLAEWDIDTDEDAHAAQQKVLQ
ncbi:MAG TPA: response regulator [Steroidobacteraceae bacterium]|jgi:HD-like signal output (HDOD) protein|nr:response regulator [Steroidobacteraceae bacterium]